MRSCMIENGYPDFLEHLRYMIATATPGMLINAVIDLSHWNGFVAPLKERTGSY
ncbi:MULTISPECIES: hypothetical protein [unclassified Wolbachia]|uniref:hypothetical protein n=1 Tax=unclassified Wolbachia TaxID=2640676 RepID=UPI00222F9286|nr:hypothetical protein [Wolbachia endosymbiont (group A) of Eupithecia tripunctaria]